MFSGRHPIKVGFTSLPSHPGLQANVDDTLKQLKGKGFEAVGAAANVSKLEDIQNIVRLATSSFGGRIDVVVSNAAVRLPGSLSLR